MVCVSATAGGDPGRGQVCFLAFLVVRAKWDWVQHTGSESDRMGGLGDLGQMSSLSGLRFHMCEMG